MPSITYGTQNSAILEASVTTVNEAKLNTMYIARSLRSKSSNNTSVSFKGEMPLRVMPSQSNITMFGCPFVNFAQYIFLDYETGTTIDNAYAITGIKHDLSPGKFTTSLTLSYGDVYGTYESMLNTIGNALKDTQGNSTLSSQNSTQQVETGAVTSEVAVETVQQAPTPVPAPVPAPAPAPAPAPEPELSLIHI